MQGTREEKEALENFMTAISYYAIITARGITTLGNIYGPKAVDKLFPGFYTAAEMMSRSDAKLKEVLS